MTSQELEDRFPDLSPREREYKIAKEKGAVFLMQIGGALASGEPHDGRAPDYDDWSLNGDIIVYYPVLDTALELSSMGYPCGRGGTDKQLEIAGCPERAQLPFQKAIIEKQLPYTIGGGIGQSQDLHVLPAESAHRRGAGFHLAGGYGGVRQKQRRDNSVDDREEPFRCLKRRRKQEKGVDRMSRNIHNERTDRLLDGILSLQNREEAYRFFEDLLYGQ